MNFGIDVPNYGKFGDPVLLLDLACESEAAGWDGFFVWDHIVAGGQSPVTDPWIALAAIATKTERIRLGPMVTPLARRRPWKVARETVALDHLSNGRLIMGVGLGAHDKAEFTAFGDEDDRKLRAQVLDEGLEILAGLWRGEPFAFKGEHYQVKKSLFKPTSVQSPRIPIWVAGLWPNKKPMRRAAAWEGAFPIGRDADLSTMMGPAAMADAIAYVQQQRTSDAPFDFVHAGLLSGDAAADAQTAQAYADIGVTWWLEHVYPSRMSISQLRKFIRQGPPAIDS